MTTTPTTDLGAARISARVTRELEMRGIDPATGLAPKPEPAPPRAAPDLATMAPNAASQPAGWETVRVMREREAERQAAVAELAEMLAEHFGCPGLLDQRHRLRLGRIHQDIEALVRWCGGPSTPVPAAEPTAPARDASGRFAKAD
jgi:hypothetical protein